MGPFPRNEISVILPISITERFSPSVFVDHYRKLSLDGGHKSFGVHFNVSAYAPVPVVARFFDMFLLWGLIYDDYTGEMEQVAEDHKWHIFVELSCAPSNDSEFANVSSIEQVLNALPILKHAAAQVSEREHPPLQVDANIALCCNFYSACEGEWIVPLLCSILTNYLAGLFRDKDPLVWLQAVQNINDDLPQGVDNLMQALLAEAHVHAVRLPDRPLHRKNFFALLADRCRWLQKYCGRLHQIQTGLVAEGMQTQPAPSPEPLFRQFIVESAHLCEKKLRKNLSKNPPVLSSLGPEPVEGPFALEVIDFRNAAVPFQVLLFLLTYFNGCN